ncbi:MAG TPA: hypothetical protein VFA55_05280, partial [Candidatus Kapabacteria bacterium]|nr:hypothetical protein [Candidatus Kapabacteria bacterium]
MLKKTIAVAAGAASAYVFLLLFEQVICFMFPLPKGINPNSPEATQQILHNMSAGAYVTLLAVYAFSSVVGGGVASFISGKTTGVPALIAGGLIMVSGIMDALEGGNPLWFSI